MVHEQLRQLLQEHDCVTLPGLGGLLAETVPARIHPVRHTLSPPSRQLAFSEKLRHDDGLLIEAVRQAMQVPALAPAQARVATFTEELRTALRQHRAAELRGLGTLRQATPEAPLRFEALGTGLLPLASAFGLPELVARPLAPERVTVATSRPALRPARLRRLLGTGAEPFYRLATAAIVALSLSATYFNLRLAPLERGQASAGISATTVVAAAEAQPVAVPDALSAPAESSVPAPEPPAAVDRIPATGNLAGPAVLAASQVTEPEAAVVEAADAQPAAPAAAASAGAKIAAPVRPTAALPALARRAVTAAPVAAAPVGATTSGVAGHHYAIWNAFSSRRQAEKGATAAVKLGAASPTVLAPPPGSTLWRVAVADYSSAAEAAAALPALRTRYHAAVWVLRK